MLRLVSRNRVSPWGAGVALVSTDSVSVDNNISTFDLSHRIPENRLSRRQNFPMDGALEYMYSAKDRQNKLLLAVPGLQSSEAVVTNKAAIRPNSPKPVPLFYKYHLGRTIKYLYQRPSVDSDNWRLMVSKLHDINDGVPTGLTAAEVQEYQGYMQSISLSILDNISISTRLAAPTDVIYDIARVTPVLIDRMSEHYGAVFDVTIYTSERCGNGLTLMVNYQAYDPEIDRMDPKATEVLNAEPVHDFHSASYDDTAQLEVSDAAQGSPVPMKQYTIKFELDE